MVEIVYYFLPQCGQFEKHGKNQRKQIELQNKIAQITFGEKSW